MSSTELAIRLLTGGESLKSREEAKRLLAEIRQPVRAEVLSEQADDVVLFCPDHGDHYASYLSCHCPVADVLRQRAAKAAASSPPPAAGDKQPETERVRAAVYEALVSFQQVAHWSTLQHAQNRDYLAEHIANALTSKGGA